MTAQELLSADGLTRIDLNAAAFRFDGGLGGYRFDIETKGLPGGTYTLSFAASGDPIAHTVSVRIR